MTDIRLTKCASVVALALAATGIGCGSGVAVTDEGVESGVGQVSEPIVGGSTDREHDAVLAIALVTRREEALCSGSLIAPNLVLTARHCVAVTASEQVQCGTSTFGQIYRPDNLWVSSSTTIGSSSFYPVREIAVPDDNSELCGSDIALMILNGQFRESSIAPIAPRLDQPAKRGELITAVGYGDALAAGDPGVRRALDGIQVLCGPNDCNAPQLLTQREFVGQQGVCDGDSGGPALDSQGRVVGVASRATEDCGLAVYSAVSPWRDWIVSVAEHAEELGNYATQEWLANEQDFSGDGTGDGVEPPLVAANDAPSASDDAPSGNSPSVAPDVTTRPSSSGGGGCSVSLQGSLLSDPAVNRNARLSAGAPRAPGAACLTAATLAGAMFLRRRFAGGQFSRRQKRAR
ncbi:MAG TPA: S1 family peptidase [Polyangiaceae bacterium]|jgi:V8-like Glu-specific endopeptidase|nr:S1 family peptidase [Polyangiaceae bacterium]